MFLESLGIPSTLADMIRGYGPITTVFTGGLIATIRFAVIPFASKVAAQWIAEKTESTKEVIAAISKISETMGTVTDTNRSLISNVRNHDLRAERIEMMISNVFDESGSDAEVRAATAFAMCLDKAHLKIWAFFVTRRQKNHILDHYEMVSCRYQRKTEDLVSMVYHDLSGFSYNSAQLSKFWGETGANEYFREIMADLLHLQAEEASGRIKSLDMDDLSDHLAHLAERMVNAFKNWLRTAQDLSSQYHTIKGHVKFMEIRK